MLVVDGARAPEVFLHGLLVTCAVRSRSRIVHYRPLIWGGLVVCFFIQGFLVYTDHPEAQGVPGLSGEAERGLRLWRGHNCQACHQIHGFGGFFGPDLTNVVSRLEEGDLEKILTAGRKRMPAFNMTSGEMTDLRAFFEALDGSGQSDPTPLAGPSDSTPPQPFEDLIDEHLARRGERLPQSVDAGYELATDLGCGACHIPFKTGRLNAPDLTLVSRRLSDRELRLTIKEGRGRMPAFRLEPGEDERLVAFLNWMAENREELRDTQRRVKGDGVRFEWGEVPWFEYR